MKKLVSKILVLSLVLGLFNIPVSAITQVELEALVLVNEGPYTLEEQAIIDAVDDDLLIKIDSFVLNVMNINNKFEFVQMLDLLRRVDNEEEFAEVYTQMFEELLPGQQIRLESFGGTVAAAANFGNYFMNEGYEVNNLDDYLGLGGDALLKPKAFRLALARRDKEFEEAVKDVDADDLAAGLSRLGKLFDMLNLARTLGGGDYFIEFLNYDYSTGVLSLLDDKALIIIGAANDILDDDISSSDEPIEGFRKLVDYVNGDLENPNAGSGDSPTYLVGLADKTLILQYLLNYGFVNGPPVEPTPTPDPIIITRRVEVEVEALADLGEDEATAQAFANFRDILPNFLWASTAIRQLNIAGVILGKDEDTFDPAGLIDRAEFAALLTRMFEAPLPEDGPSNDASYESVFTDVTSPSWYVDEVHAAYVAGYVKGIGKGLFAPTQKITKEQIATMIGRVLEEKGVAAPLPSEFESILSGFADADEVSTWAMSGAAMCVDLNLIVGKEVDGETVFGFSGYANRAEVSVILYRLVEEGLIETNVQIFNPIVEDEASLDL